MKGVKDGLSYTPSCLWKEVEKMEFAQKTRYRFRFMFVFLLAQEACTLRFVLQFLRLCK